MTASRTLIAGAVNRCQSACFLCILGILVIVGCVSNPPPGVTAIHDLQYGLGIGSDPSHNGLAIIKLGWKWGFTR